MSLIMSIFHLVTGELLASELLKIAVLNFVSVIETWFLNQSGPNLHEVFLGTRSRMNSIMSKICQVTRELLIIAVWTLIVTTFFNQFGPKVHKVFIGTRYRMCSIMRVIRLVTHKLFALELFKISVLNLVSATETWFLNQLGPKLHKVFIGTISLMYSIMSEIFPVTETLFLNHSGLKFTTSI